MLTLNDILMLIPVAAASATFCVFLAISVGYISLSKKVPKIILWITVITQVALSVGIFIMATLWYYSSATPDGMPKDFMTGAAIAYTAGAFPGTTLGMLVIVLSLVRIRLKKLFKDQASDEEIDFMLPSIRMQSLVDRYHKDKHREARIQKRENDKQKTEDINNGTDSKDNS